MAWPTKNVFEPPRLEGWFELNNCLHGTVYNHPLVKDGTFVRTSKLVGPVDKDSKTARTTNRIYQLGTALMLNIGGDYSD